MTNCFKEQKRLKRIETLLKKSDVLVSSIPTNVLFVSNSSVLCGVSLEELEDVFLRYDKYCSFIVYPTSKSYSFVIFSDASRAVQAYHQLMNTKPFKQDKTTGITLAYIAKLPQKAFIHQSNTKYIEGLTVLPEFVDADSESIWTSFVDAKMPSISTMKNRRVLHFGYEFNYAENNALVTTRPIPASLHSLIDQIMVAVDLKEGQRPDQITVNIYEPGQGIPPHVDTHSAFEEPIISLSLVSDIVMEFRDCANSSDSTNILLPCRSLLVMKGPGRYRYKHGIMSRKYDINPVDNRLMARQRRISFTFRRVRRKPCECPFVEFCDWDRSGKMALPASNSDGQSLENEYVAKVYEQIASHFDETRRNTHWAVVNKFLDQLSEHSFLLDAGCGNGKYLIREDTLCKIGCDLSENLLLIAHQKQCQVFRGDALALPIKSNSMDAVISIAVIHHLSTKQRRIQALLEIERVLRVGGQAIVTVWSMEQQGGDNQQESAYAKMRNRKLDSEDSCAEKRNIKLEVHDGKNFKQQDMLVPWNDVNSNQQFLRYYHLFVSGELTELVTKLSSCRIISNEHEEGNWAICFKKIR